LAALMKRYGVSGKRAVLYLAYFFLEIWIETCLLNMSFIFVCLFLILNLLNK
jgi:hypothetical protein